VTEPLQRIQQRFRPGIDALPRPCRAPATGGTGLVAARNSSDLAPADAPLRSPVDTTPQPRQQKISLKVEQLGVPVTIATLLGIGQDSREGSPEREIGTKGNR
jgi:hypothetical protein